MIKMVKNIAPAQPPMKLRVGSRKYHMAKRHKAIEPITILVMVLLVLLKFTLYSISLCVFTLLQI